jgi:hypothetical protein
VWKTTILILLAGLGTLLGSCGPEEVDGDLIQMTLHVSNQSLVVTDVRIRVDLDGDEIFDRNLPSVGPDGGIPQHYLLTREFKIPRGTHVLTASTGAGNDNAVSETFDGENPLWVLVEFWGDSLETGITRISFSDSEMYFL